MVPCHDETHERQRLAAEFQRVYADALLAGMPHVAEATIREAIEAGLDEEILDDHVIRPAMRLVGDLWADGEISIADEHLATSISMRVLTLQREAFRTARERASQRVLLAAAEGEQHVMGLQMASSVLLHAGYDVRMLGADLPVSEIGAAVAAHKPAVTGFTAATALTASRLPATFDAVRDVSADVGIVVGGQGVDDGWSAMWDVVVCHHVTDAVACVDALVKRAGRN